MSIGKTPATSIVLGALVLLTVMGAPPALASVDTTAPEAFLERPLADATVSGEQVIEGWALDAQSSVQSVGIWVDGAPMTRVIFPASREDGNLGFRLLWDTRSWPNGPHTIKIRIVNGRDLAAELERTVRVANGAAPPADSRDTLSFAGTWSSAAGAAPGGDDPLLGITVDLQNRLTLWAISRDQQTRFYSAQGVLEPDGSLDLLAAGGLARVAGQVAADRQSVRVTVSPPDRSPFTVVGRGLPGYNPRSRQWAGTFTGVLPMPDGDQMRVVLSIDPSGNATCQAEVGWLRQSSICRVTPGGGLLLPGPEGNDGFPMGWLAVVDGGVLLRYGFWHPEHPYLFEVPLQQFQPASASPTRPVDLPIRLMPKEAD